MDEIAAVTPTFAGVSFAKLDELGSVQWPCNERAPEGTPVMHMNGFVRGRGNFVITEYHPTDERSSRRFPLYTLGADLDVVPERLSSDGTSGDGRAYAGSRADTAILRCRSPTPMRFRNLACSASAFSSDLDLALDLALGPSVLRLEALVVYIGGSKAIGKRWEFGAISQGAASCAREPRRPDRMANPGKPPAEDSCA